MALTVAAAAVVALTACGSSPGSRPQDAAQADAASSSAPASASRTLAETGSSLMAPLFARAFLSWAVTTGTAQLAKVNFQPLPPSIITLSDAQIARIEG